MAKSVKMNEQIGEYVFDLYPLTTSQGLKVMARLAKLLTEPLAILGDSSLQAFKKGTPKAAGDGDDQALEARTSFNMADVLKMDFSANMLGDAARALVSRMDEAEMVDTVKALVEPFAIKAPGDHGTRRMNFESDFRGEMGLLLQVVQASIEVNFGDFWSGVAGNLGRFRKATPTNQAR